MLGLGMSLIFLVIIIILGTIYYKVCENKKNKLAELQKHKLQTYVKELEKENKSLRDNLKGVNVEREKLRREKCHLDKKQTRLKEQFLEYDKKLKHVEEMNVLHQQKCQHHYNEVQELTNKLDMMEKMNKSERNLTQQIKKLTEEFEVNVKKQERLIEKNRRLDNERKKLNEDVKTIRANIKESARELQQLKLDKHKLVKETTRQEKRLSNTSTRSVGCQTTSPTPPESPQRSPPPFIVPITPVQPRTRMSCQAVRKLLYTDVVSNKVTPRDVNFYDVTRNDVSTPPRDERDAVSIEDMADADVTGVDDDAQDDVPQDEDAPATDDVIPINKVLEFLCLPEVKNSKGINDVGENVDDVKDTGDLTQNTCDDDATNDFNDVTDDTGMNDADDARDDGDDITKENALIQTPYGVIDEPMLDYMNYDFYSLMFGHHVSQQRPV